MMRAWACSGVPMGTTSIRLIWARTEWSNVWLGNEPHAAKVHVRAIAEQSLKGRRMECLPHAAAKLQNYRGAGCDSHSNTAAQNTVRVSLRERHFTIATRERRIATEFS
jgi:hypothetical protein